MRKASAVIEPVAALIAGFVFARFSYFQGLVYTSQITAERLASTYGGFVVGITLVGGLGLAVEIICRWGKGGVWGLGRWIWSLSALSIALLLIETSIDTPLYRTKWLGQPTSFHSLLGFFHNDLTFSLGRICLHLSAFLVVSSLVRSPGSGVADAREWAGRALGVALLTWWVGAGMIEMYTVLKIRWH